MIQIINPRRHQRILRRNALDSRYQLRTHREGQEDRDLHIHYSRYFPHICQRFFIQRLPGSRRVIKYKDKRRKLMPSGRSVKSEAAPLIVRPAHLHTGQLLCFYRGRRRTAEALSPDQYCHMARIFRQEYTLRGSCKSAADHNYII